MKMQSQKNISMKAAEVIEKVNNTKYWSLSSFEEDFDLEMVAPWALC